ncbi:hypothetical protein J7413_00785 [Shimia sp. R10_1]|uniref:hypothetical protein n=1 Tax=Shimia sp. R10_1 TaxID=2821095 RepID=UPI001ADAA17C|nr:hypothetical protein [Shimia sp. R10_1]MBO9472063.1 hypothetical protein [Shimia sp. R10_1]
MAEDDTRPVIREVRPWYRWMRLEEGVYPELNARLLRVQSTRFRFGERMTSQARSLPEIDVILRMRLAIGDAATKRSRHWPGRLYNAVVGESARYSRFNGHEVRDVLSAIGAETEGLVDPNGTYDLRLDFLRDILVRIAEERG